jgi:amino acid adenylation domain-containing protein
VVSQVSQVDRPAPKVAGASVEESYPLSPLQRGMLFHWLYGDDSGVYVNQLRMDVEGIDTDRFAAAWQQLIERHPALRTSFVRPRGNDEGHQVVHRRVPFVLREVDLRGHDASPAALRALAEEERRLPFDPERPPLFRIKLLRTAERRHHLIWTYHHALMDGWSQARFTSDLLGAYAGEEIPDDPQATYSDYIAWIGRQDLGAAERFWAADLQGLAEPTLIANVWSRPREGTGERRFTSELSREQTRDLTAFARRERITLNTLVQGAWLILLARYTGREKVVTGVTVAGRPPGLPGVEAVLGLFINTLPLARDVRPEQLVGGWLRDVQRHNLSLRDYEYSALNDVQRWARRPGQPLFDTLISFENYPLQAALDASRHHPLRIVDIQVSGSTNYALVLEVNLGECLRIDFCHSCALLADWQVEAISEQLKRVLGELSQSAQRPLSALDLATPVDQALLARWNATSVDYGPARCVHEEIALQAAKTPDAVAVVSGASCLSYAELEARAKRLASELISLGVGPEVLVGVCLERGLELEVALLAVLKAGGAYVPLDPEYPSERLRLMVDDSKMSLLLTEERLRGCLPALSVRTLCLDGKRQPAPASPRPPLSPRACVDNLMYCIYTSGSSGQPKGAGNTHRAVHNRLRWMQEEYRLTAADRVLQKTPISFDVSVWELFWPLMNGATLVMASVGVQREPAALAREIVEQGVTTLHFVPSMLEAFVSSGELQRCAPLRQVMSSGEALPVELAQRFMNLHPAELHNLYGPTEAAVDVTSFACRRGAVSGTIPIGKPIANTTIRVLDIWARQQPVGVAGELHIGGVAPARGYHGHPARTAERFVPDAFSECPGGRAYRTGDLVRWLPSGELEYLGRLDDQVKVRGHRIELGEIAARLREQPEVKDAAVVVANGPLGKQLVAYVVLHGAAAEAAETLRARLRQVLPEVMVPAYIVPMAALPLSPNGKLDRKALPAPERGSREDDVPPSSPAEHALSAIWCDILQLKRVSVTANFFDVGGDSIISLRIVARARELGFELLPKDIFVHQTIRALAQISDASGKISGASLASSGNGASVPAPGAEREPLELSAGARSLLDRADVEDVYPLSPMQQGMLFHSAQAGGAYIRQLVVPVYGLDVDRLRAAWQDATQRHECLRTGFVSLPDSAGMVQVVRRSVALSWRVADIRSDRARLDEMAREQRAEFDLAEPPLQRLLVLTTSDDCHHLVWTYHHAILDGWSAERLLEEVLRAYMGAPVVAPSRRYRDYIAWLAQTDGKACEAIWRAEVEALEAPTRLSVAPLAAGDTLDVGRLVISLSAEETARLRRRAERDRLTLNTLVQGAWLLLLYRHTGQNPVAFGSTVAGRPAEFAGELAPLGLFINTLPVIRKVEPQCSAREWLAGLQQRNLELGQYEHAPLYEIQRWAGRAGQTLFDTAVLFENYPIADVLRRAMPEAPRFGEAGGTDVTSHPLTLLVRAGERMDLEYRYSERHFGERQVAQVAQHMRQLLVALSEDTSRPLGQLGMLDPAQEVAARVSAAAARSADRVHEWTARQAAATPDAIAATAGTDCLSYRALEARSNQLARLLREIGVGPDVLVGVCLQRSLALPVVLLAILKAGGAYVPFAPDYPRERLRYMIDDSAIGLIVTEEGLLEVLPAGQAKLWCVDRDWRDAAALPADAVDAVGGDRHLAYCIYTSGSTGQPKGVLLEHGALANHMRWMVNAFGFDAGARVLQRTPLSFDASVWECWLPLLVGGTLIVDRGDVSRNPLQLLEVVARQQVSVLQLVPQLLDALTREPAFANLKGLTHLFCGGDALASNLVHEVARLRVGVFCNLYGPTEATIDATYWSCAEQAASAIAPIGSTLTGVSAHVLSADLHPLPAGLSGELWLGGQGIARGYLGRPALTADRFVPDPFGPPGARLYRTGDVAKSRDDGVLEYLGRVDQQVKIRGYRVELGEIEAAIREHAAVRDVAVQGQATPGGDVLVAYVVPDGAPSASIGELRQRLAAALPAYMLPAQFIVLDEMPLTDSGKIDRKALPKATFHGNGHVEPTTELGRQLAEIWRDVLTIERVGMDDNFFELGGHSLLAIQVVARVRSLLHIAVPLQCLLEASSLADFEQSIHQNAYSFAASE